MFQAAPSLFLGFIAVLQACAGAPRSMRRRKLGTCAGAPRSMRRRTSEHAPEQAWNTSRPRLFLACSKPVPGMRRRTSEHAPAHLGACAGAPRSMRRACAGAIPHIGNNHITTPRDESSSVAMIVKMPEPAINLITQHARSVKMENRVALIVPGRLAVVCELRRAHLPIEPTRCAQFGSDLA